MRLPIGMTGLGYPAALEITTWLFRDRSSDTSYLLLEVERGCESGAGAAAGQIGKGS
jgi:hypothetical protein